MAEINILEKLCRKRKQLLNKLEVLRKQILEEELKEYDFQYKFVHSDMNGYMYVTWQEVEGDKMFLQGLHFKSSFSTYRDDSYFTYDAMAEWRIPLEIFKIDIKSGSFREVAKEEFTGMMTEACNAVLDAYNKQLEKLIEIKDEREED